MTCWHFLNFLQSLEILPQILMLQIHSSSHPCLPKFCTIFLGIFPIISATGIFWFISLNLEINFEASFLFPFYFLAHKSTHFLRATPACQLAHQASRPTRPGLLPFSILGPSRCCTRPPSCHRFASPIQTGVAPYRLPFPHQSPHSMVVTTSFMAPHRHLWPAASPPPQHL
jgi:hypothetical protein